MGLNSYFIKQALFCVLFCCIYNVYSQTPDFKVQHIQNDVSRTGGVNTAFTPLSSLNNTIELANNNRKTHAGSNTNSGTLEGDDMSGARQLTDASTLTYYRESASVDRDMRMNTSLWEYIGAASGGNEFIVRGRYAVALNGSTNSVTQALSGITNANKCIPFVTGILNDASSNNADSGTAIAYLENATTLRVQKGSDDNDVIVYVTLVEFTGANWTVLHADSGAVSSDSGSFTLRNASDGTGASTNVSNWNDAIIFSHFRADNNDSGDNQAIADLWPVVRPGGNNQTVDWSFHSNHDSDGLNRHFVHVLVNNGLNVTRFQNTSNNAGESTIDITSAGLSDVNQAIIVGSSTSSGNGTAYGRGWRNYYLKSATQAAHWAHRSNNSLSHEIQIVDLSGLQTSYTGPEINVLGNGVSISDGNTAISLSDDTNFGDIEATGAVTVSHTFTIQNLGNQPLTLDGASPYIVITGDTADFTLTVNPSTPIAAGGTTTFTIVYDPTTSGDHTATISIANNDSDEDPYTFNIGGRGEYCAAVGSLDWDTSVTYVAFNTLSNADNEIPKDNPFEDFTTMSTTVYKNDIHNLTVNVNTDGNYTVYTLVWIDWNMDGDYDDAGEEYDMGSATNVVDMPTTNSPLAISIPLNAEIGLTGMRVATKYYSYPSSCDSDFDGEVEDYSVNVVDHLIDFNGSSQSVDFGDNHDLTGAFSLESWVLQEASATTGTVLSKGNIDLSLKTGYHLSVKNDFPSLIWYDNGNNEVLNIVSPYAIPNNQWHHLAATYDGTTARLYVDGIEVVSGSPTSAPLNTPQSFKIGAGTVNYTSTPLRADYFNGSIQEVRIWDVALSASQIREMMNQHIEQSGSNVNGVSIPLNISGGLLWSNLKGYYPLDSNTALDSSGSGVDGLPVKIDSSQSTSAPLPYETDEDNNWDSTSTWLDKTDIYIPNTIGVDGSTSIDWNIVELSNDVSSGTRDITLLGLISSVGKLTITGTSDINTGTGTGQSLTISRYLELDGVIDLEGESQLVQSEGSVVDADSGGALERDQQGTANSFNYNYWSSSVGPISGNAGTRGTGVAYANSNFSISGVLLDGTSSTNQAITFSSSITAADSTIPTIPFTLSTYWLYKYYGASNDYNAWGTINESSALNAGEGYTMKGTSGAANILNDFQNYVFNGIPNNGDISLPLIKNVTAGNPTGNVERLIGNPYPSAIDATKFILDNLSIADGGTNATGTVINGALYFWDHFGEENSHNTGAYVGGYATRNLTGGVAAISNDALINNTSDGGSAATGTKIPGQYVSVNQGFFVSTTLDGFDDNNGNAIATVDGGNILFKNSQRVFSTEGSGNSVFLRTLEVNSTSDESEESLPGIRLLYDSPEGYHRHILIGLNQNASNGFDLGYDAFITDVGIEDMYWIINDSKFVIQGVNNFNADQEFDLGLIVSEAGAASIRVEAFENIDYNLNVYIKDKTTGLTVQINEDPFEVNLPVGTYNERFKLVFQPSEMLDLNEVIINNGVSVYYNADESEIRIVNKEGLNILDVTLYNLIGQKIKSLKFSTSMNTLPVNVSTGAYIVKINTSKGVVNKKIIID